MAGANLTDADLTNATLIDADLRGANLTGADPRGANLRGTIYCNTVMQTGDLNNTGCP